MIIGRWKNVLIAIGIKLNKKYLIYLDVCCLNRPLDDLQQTMVRLEAEAITEIIQNCENQRWKLSNSDIIEFEVSQHSDSFKRQRINDILKIAKIYLSSNEEIDLRAQELMQLNFKYHDALHLAFAEAGKVDIFLTTDKRLLNKAQNYQKILTTKVDNPVIWLMNILQIQGE